MSTETVEAGKDQLRRSIEATEKAVRLIREGDLKRRQISLELRDLQLTMLEDFDLIKAELIKLDKMANDEGNKNKWILEKLENAKKQADLEIKAHISQRDVQVMEKKIEILKESMSNVHKSFFKYDSNVDVNELSKQVAEMTYRTQKREDLLSARFGGQKLEDRAEEAFRGSVEALLSLKFSNPTVMAESRELANEIRIYRDISANENFVDLISKSDTEHRRPQRDDQRVEMKKLHKKASTTALLSGGSSLITVRSKTAAPSTATTSTFTPSAFSFTTTSASSKK